MQIFRQIAAIFLVTLKRLRAQAGLTLATTIGLTMAVALLVTVPLYADAVNFRILEEQLSNASNTQRPPWAYMYHYVGSWRGPVEYEATLDVDDYLLNTAPNTIGLPLELAVRHIETPFYRLFTADESFYDEDFSLGLVKFATTLGIEEQITLLEGSFPAAELGPDRLLQVAIAKPFADEVGWQVGERYLALYGKEFERHGVTVEVAGIWEAADPTSPFWFYSPSSFEDLFLITEEAYQAEFVPTLDDEVGLAIWYLVMDGSRVGVNQVDQLIASAARVEQRVETLLPNTRAFIAPTDELRAYRRSVSELSLLLYTFNVAPVWLVMSFLGLVIGLAVGQQRNEIAVMRSRGSTPAQVLGMAMLEGVLLGSVALGLGLVAALGLTQLIGRSRSFLDFTSETVVRVGFTRASLYAGLLVIGVALMIRLVPAVAASQHTIITFKQEQARSLQGPWWQRFWLDIVLFAISGYGFYLLNQQGSLAVAVEGGAADPFQNPLLLVLPALSIFALTLLFLRVLPWLMNGVSYLLLRTNNVALMQAVRYLGRTPHHYRPPLNLLILTVGLAVYTASLARTVDLQLYDETFYEVGSDLNMLTSPQVSVLAGFGQQDEDEEPFTYLPVTEYELIEGIGRATRVARYNVRSQIDGRGVQGRYVGVDADSFREVAYWRWDFSQYRLGSLMNALGNHVNGVLVPETLIGRTSLRVGDPLRYSVFVEGTQVDFEGVIVGTFRYFPTWYPDEDELLIVGNLNTLFEGVGGEVPYRVWATTDAPVTDQELRTALNERRLFNTSWQEPESVIARTQAEPARQGLFGVLSVGFIASALLTVLGFFLYTLFSFRRRMVEMGVLRAVGINRRTMIAIVAWELVLLILFGLLVGTALGVVVSQQFVPFLQVGGSGTAAPPYLVEVAWEAVGQIYILFGGLFFVALAALSWRLANMKVFESIKLGETV